MTLASSFAPSTLAMSALMMSASTSASVLTTPRPPRTHAPGCIPSSASTPTCRTLPIQHDLTTPRARARAARLRANEAAEHREDQAALITTPAQWALLRRSFVGVKTEFADLDGLSWNVHRSELASGLAPVPASTGAARLGTTYRPVCASASVPALALDDRTVRPPNQRKKQRLSVPVPGWEQAVPAMVAHS
ncbi:hypothetical protein BJY52DRAFT_1224026 [Lactarius psammicola]|nr:hypothetical protein BJY52DRAFT_1224026 [Lactarius psammicola]